MFDFIKGLWYIFSALVVIIIATICVIIYYFWHIILIIISIYLFIKYGIPLICDMIKKNNCSKKKKKGKRK